MDNCKMCPKWNIQGFCFKDCQNAQSHVPHSEYSADHKTTFGNWMAECRRAALPQQITEGSGWDLAMLGHHLLQNHPTLPQKSRKFPFKTNNQQNRK
jgi:hypothetical protein